MVNFDRKIAQIVDYNVKIAELKKEERRVKRAEEKQLKNAIYEWAKKSTVLVDIVSEQIKTTAREISLIEYAQSRSFRPDIFFSCDDDCAVERESPGA